MSLYKTIGNRLPFSEVSRFARGVTDSLKIQDALSQPEWCRRRRAFPPGEIYGNHTINYLRTHPIRVANVA